MAKKPNSFVPHSHIPYGKDGSGFYSDHHLTCYHVSRSAIPLVVDAVQSTDIQTDSVFTIVDYGSADGGTSMPLMYACVKAIREKYGDELPINIIYEDQPVNDFKSLFMRLQGLIPGPPSYLVDFSNVFVMASGTNFYDQCCPGNSVTLGYAATSLHWLSKKPCNLTDAIFVHCNTVAEENEKFREQAAKDWERILLKRATELKPGGTLVCVNVYKGGKSQYIFAILLHEMLLDKWKEMQEEKLITLEEFKETNFIAYFRTEEEFKKPFECPHSPVNQAAMKLVSIETQIIPCSFREIWMKEKGDPKEHAKRLVDSWKVWGYSTFISGLSDARSKEEKTGIVDELYRRCEEEVANHLEDYWLDIPTCFMVIEKRVV